MMLIGQVIQFILGLFLALLFSLATVLLPSLLRSNQLFLDLPLKLNIGHWLLLLLSCFGLGCSFMIWAYFFPILLCYGVIMLVLWPLLLILSSMLVQITLRWITILCMRRFLGRIFWLNLFLPMISLLIFLLKGCLLLGFTG